MRLVEVLFVRHMPLKKVLTLRNLVVRLLLEPRPWDDQFGLSFVHGDPLV